MNSISHTYALTWLRNPLITVNLSRSAWQQSVKSSSWQLSGFSTLHTVYCHMYRAYQVHMLGKHSMVFFANYMLSVFCQASISTAYDTWRVQLGMGSIKTLRTFRKGRIIHSKTSIATKFTLDFDKKLRRTVVECPSSFCLILAE